jgi:hypothetical protein
VSAGCIGTEADWERWEEQLIAGAQFRDLRARDALTVSDDYKGFIIRRYGWMYSHHAAQVDLVEEATRALRHWPDIAPRETLIRMCCFLLQNLTHPRRADPVPLPPSSRKSAGTRIRNIVEASSDLNMCLPSSILSAIILSEAPLKEKQDLLARVGRQGMRQWTLEDLAEIDGRLGSELPQLLASSNQAYILRALSFLPPLAAMRQLKGAPLDNLRTGNREFFDAASILKSSCLYWTLQEIPELVKHLLAIKSDYPLHVTQLNAFIERNSGTGPEIEAFFLEVMTQSAAANDIDLLETATSRVVKLLDRRSPVSCLPETAVPRLS